MTDTYNEETKVKYDEEDKFLTVRDENDTAFKVKLFPEHSCSRKIFKRSKCTHLLSVMQANSQPITDGYKLPNLSQLARSKRNGKLNGRKRRV